MNMSFSELERRADQARAYRAARGNMQYRALDAFNFISGDDPLAMDMEQFVCAHSWAINEESDRCYCMNCGLDGDA